MKLFGRYLKSLTESSKAVQARPTRRGVLHSMVAGMAAYATSFFVTNTAMANFPCSGVHQCFQNKLKEGQCKKCDKLCHPPMPGNPCGFVFDVTAVP